MLLSGSFARAALVGGAAAVLGGGAAAAIVTNMGAPPTPLQGHTALATLPESGATVQRMTVDGSKLKSNMGYSFNNVSVVINGNVPAGDHINGTNGQLLVTGNVGDNVNIDVNVPEFTRVDPQTCYMWMSTGTNGSGYMMPYDCSTTTDLGPQPPFNKDPAIVIEGKMGRSVSLSGSTGINISTRP